MGKRNKEGTGKEYSCMSGPNGWSSYLTVKDGKSGEWPDRATLDCGGVS